ncbi:MAG: hypothetical protein ACOCRX_03955 [Candidatus Woesearchaeota archaeon]
METTEKAFKQWCNKKKYFCKKLLTHTATGHGNNQEADFIVGTKNNVYLVECKERKSDRFEFNGLSQELKLNLVQKKTNVITPIILIRFVNQKTIVKLTLNEFLELKNQCQFKNGKYKKSINITEIPNQYKFSWKSLNL